MIYKNKKLLGAVLTTACFIALASHAQITNIYDAQNSDVAGINSLMSAVTSNDVDGVKFFSKAGPPLVNQKNIGGATALHLAAREGNFEIAQVLVESGADVNILDNEGWTPLMRASLSGNDEIVNLLLANRADAGVVNSMNESALTYAAASSCNDCLNSMFEKFNFAQSMNQQVLKDQLSTAFIVARDHENEEGQGIITAYLDQVVKMSTTPVTAVQNPQNQNQQDASIAAQYNPQQEIPNQASPVEAALPSKTESIEPALTASDVSNVKKKTYKLVSGETGENSAPVVSNVAAAPILVGNNNCDCSKKEQPQISQGESKGEVEPKIKEKIFVLRSEPKEQNPVATSQVNSSATDSQVNIPAAALPNNSAKVIYILKRGPEGKIIKRKPQPKVKKVVEKVVPAAVAPVENSTQNKDNANAINSASSSSTAAVEDITKTKVISAAPAVSDNSIPAQEIPATNLGAVKN